MVTAKAFENLRISLQINRLISRISLLTIRDLRTAIHTAATTASRQTTRTAEFALETNVIGLRTIEITNPVAITADIMALASKDNVTF